jgi:AcrR family transcriptional regulator
MGALDTNGHDGAVGTADQRRAQMLHAALDIISERGYAETRIADVAERAGVSPALVIYYYKTKDQLLTEAIRSYEDTWYSVGQERIANLPTAAARLEEYVAMTCLAKACPQLNGSPQLWLEFWTLAARNEAVASVRRQSDARWRDAITSLVRAGQDAGEFSDIDAASFAICLSALLDGLTVQLALGDPVVDPTRAFRLTMRIVADQLGFSWHPGPRPRTVANGRSTNVDA